MLSVNKVNGEKLDKPRNLKEVKATVEDCRKIYEFQLSMQKNMDKKIFAVDNPKFIEKMLTSKESIIMMYFDDEILVGIFELNIPDDKTELDEFNILDYKNNIDKGKIAICESIAVKPEYRGNGLQYKFIEIIEELAKEKGYKYIIGTVHPDNIYSCNNFKRQNYEFLDKIEVYYGWRYIVFKEIAESLEKAKMIS